MICEFPSRRLPHRLLTIASAQTTNYRTMHLAAGHLHNQSTYFVSQQGGSLCTQSNDEQAVSDRMIGSRPQMPWINACLLLRLGMRLVSSTDTYTERDDFARGTLKDTRESCGQDGCRRRKGGARGSQKRAERGRPTRGGSAWRKPCGNRDEVDWCCICETRHSRPPDRPGGSGREATSGSASGRRRSPGTRGG
jgi:hypothetical protein